MLYKEEMIVNLELELKYVLSSVVSTINSLDLSFTHYARSSHYSLADGTRFACLITEKYYDNSMLIAHSVWIWIYLYAFV